MLLGTSCSPSALVLISLTSVRIRSTRGVPSDEMTYTSRLKGHTEGLGARCCGSGLLVDVEWSVCEGEGREAVRAWVSSTVTVSSL